MSRMPVMRRPEVEPVRRAVHQAIRSYRPGSPITMEDIRIACRLDGHPVDGVSHNLLGALAREICTVEIGPGGSSDYRTYRWHREGARWSAPHRNSFWRN